MKKEIISKKSKNNFEKRRINKKIKINKIIK